MACDEVREAEGREEETSNKTSDRKMRKGEKIKQQGKRTKPPFHETCEDRQSGSVLTPPGVIAAK